MPPVRWTPQASSPIGPGIEAFIGRDTDAESGRMAAGISLHFPSTFPPPDALPHGTERNAQGRRGTAGVVGGPFALVRPDSRGQVGIGRDLQGAELAACKIAG